MSWPVQAVYFVEGECGMCHQVCRYNPRTVMLVLALGERHPICRTCLQEANRHLARRGLPLHRIPADAYEPDPS